MIAQSLKKILLAVSFLCLFGYTNHAFGQSNIKIQVSVIEKLSPDKFKDHEGTFYSVNIDMFNNTDSIIKFWTMYVWQVNWISNTKELHLYMPNNIDQDYSLIQQIDSGQKITLKGEIYVLGTLKDIQKKNFKLGFIFIEKKEANSMNNFLRLLVKKRKEGKDIIWSEPFKITR